MGHGEVKFDPLWQDFIAFIVCRLHFFETITMFHQTKVLLVDRQVFWLEMLPRRFTPSLSGRMAWVSRDSYIVVCMLLFWRLYWYCAVVMLLVHLKKYLRAQGDLHRRFLFVITGWSFNRCTGFKIVIGSCLYKRFHFKWLKFCRWKKRVSGSNRTLIALVNVYIQFFCAVWLARHCHFLWKKFGHFSL